MRKIKLIAVLPWAIFLAAVTLFVWQPWHGKTRPNIILIVADTLRADHLPLYGYIHTETPYLSSLAKRSIVFKHAWSSSSWTAPATASIMTSLRPFQHGVLHNMTYPIPEKAYTLAEILKEAGYRTFGVSMNIMVNRQLRFNQGFDRFVTIPHKKHAEHANAQVLAWEKEINGSPPYFLYIHYMDCHKPYPQWAPWYRKQADRKDDLIARYDSSICYLDGQIRRLANRLGWERNTLIIFTADHGEEFLDHGKWDHGKTLFRESIHVPLLLHPPSGTVPGEVQDNVTVNDILPTVREVLGLPRDPANVGISLAHYWKKKSAAASDRLIYSHLERLVTKRGRKAGFRYAKLSEIKKVKTGLHVTRAVISGKWHMIFIESTGEEFLFDWRADPGEQNDLGRVEPLIVHRLKEKFLSIESMSRKYSPSPKLIELDAAKLKELETLGYL
jgi:arylsulfatase A-like enzyme